MAAHGIGKAIAIKFAEEGADVAIFDINLPKAEEVGEIDPFGPEAVHVGCAQVGVVHVADITPAFGGFTPSKPLPTSWRHVFSERLV